MTDDRLALLPQVRAGLGSGGCIVSAREGEKATTLGKVGAIRESSAAGCARLRREGSIFPTPFPLPPLPDGDAVLLDDRLKLALGAQPVPPHLGRF